VVLYKALVRSRLEEHAISVWTEVMLVLVLVPGLEGQVVVNITDWVV